MPGVSTQAPRVKTVMAQVAGLALTFFQLYSDTFIIKCCYTHSDGSEEGN